MGVRKPHKTKAPGLGAHDFHHFEWSCNARIADKIYYLLGACIGDILGGLDASNCRDFIIV